MHKFIKLIQGLLFPPRCPVCDKIVPLYEQGICMGCLKEIQYVKPPRCFKCGKHIEDETEEYCMDCSKIQHFYREGRSLYQYKEVAKAIYRFKYRGRREYAEVFGEEMAYYLGEEIQKWKADALIPVPLYKYRERRRGYNQAMLLAQVLGGFLDIPVYGQYVKRIKNTKPLKLLNPEERLNNLKKAFIIAENGVKLNSVIIIDDIYTTGSTIDTIAQLLSDQGVEKIYFLTIAIGENI